MRHGRKFLLALFALGLGHIGNVPTARAGEPLDERFGIRIPSIFLLTRSDVQVDLKLDPQLIPECHRAAASLRRKASTLKGKRGPAMVAARRVVDAAMTEWLSTHLTPEQLGRLDQIDLQWEGASALRSRPMLDESLNLTPDQQEKVDQYISAGKVQRTHGVWTYEDHVNLTRKAIALLNDRQKDLWIHVLGRPCRFNLASQSQTAPTQPATPDTRIPLQPQR